MSYVHPLADARAEQESSKLNRDLGLVIREAIISRLSREPYRVHADDLESAFPAAHVERCRKLAGAQFGGLAGAGHIREVERRKSVVPSRKGAKSSVYEFTISGRRKLAAGVAAGDDGLGTFSEASSHPGGADAQPAGTPDSQEPGSDTNPAAPSACGDGSEGVGGASSEPARLFTPPPLNPLRDQEAA